MLPAPFRAAPSSVAMVRTAAPLLLVSVWNWIAILPATPAFVVLLIEPDDAPLELNALSEKENSLALLMVIEVRFRSAPWWHCRWRGC